VVEVCGLAQVLGKVIRTLSHGYRQRVGLAQALIHDPPILILDEPTSDLDPNEKAEFLEYLKQIGQDRTVMLSTHNLAEVESACARAIIVRKGRVVADGPLDEIRAKSGKVRYVVSIQESPQNGTYRGTGSPPTQQQVEDALRSITGVEAIKELPTDERAHSYALTADQKLDLRAELFAMIAGKGWVLLELVREIQTLESVFRNLTIGDELRNRRVGGDDEEEEEEEEESDEEESDEDESDDDEEEEEEEEEDEEDEEEDDDEEEEEEDEDDEDEGKK
jgi:ABC-2 type transport system ATP-binding protein